MKRFPQILSAFSFLILLPHCTSGPSGPASPASAVIFADGERPSRVGVEATGARFALATQGIAATRAAQDILRAGGNLIDAAVAASFVVSVERPQSTGLGGGGFMVFHDGRSGKNYAVDFRERAPLRATERMYIGADGKPDKNLSRNGILAVAVPGLVAGLSEVHHRFGSLPWSRVVQPAIDLAEKGFPIYPQLAEALAKRADRLGADPSSRAVFMDADGRPLPAGHVLVQKDLGQTLRFIAQNGRHGFDQGPVAQKIVRFSRSQQGLLSARDLLTYQVKWREPLQSTFRGYQVVAMPPPSSGGIHVIQYLNFLEGDHPAKDGFLSAPALHLSASALQAAFADRARFLGDPDFVKIPVRGLIAKDYARQRRSQFSADRARAAGNVEPGAPEADETTHMSFMDDQGNAVSTTQTVNGWMGAGIMAPGTGFLLNNEMDDFSAQVGSSNMYGAIGGQADAIAPRKTPLSSMSPTLLLKDGAPVVAIGAPGGTRIISCVAQTIYNLLEFQIPLYDAISSIRIHQQWQPDSLLIDPPGPRPDVLARLRQMGYQIEVRPVGCTVMAVQRESGGLFRAVADPRDIGTSAAE